MHPERNEALQTKNRMYIISKVNGAALECWNVYKSCEHLNQQHFYIKTEHNWATANMLELQFSFVWCIIACDHILTSSLFCALLGTWMRWFKQHEMQKGIYSKRTHTHTNSESESSISAHSPYKRNCKHFWTTFVH